VSTFSNPQDRVNAYVLISRTTVIQSEKPILTLTDDAREAAQKELEDRTGKTESEGEESIE
jgi:hypothetical protein